MTKITILTEQQLRQCVDLDEGAIDIVAGAFSSLAAGKVVMPPILRLDVEEHNGEVDVKTAYVPGLDSFAIKISPGFFDNPKLGLPSVNGLMVLFNAKTGLVEALLLDNGYLTDVRTAAAGAVAGKHLSRADVAMVGVIGAGIQARLQVRALKLVRDFHRLLVWARDSEKARACAEDIAAKLGIETEVAETPEAVVRGSDIVITTTPSRDPLIAAEWLHPGLHITAMGSDAEHKNEIQPAVVARVDRFFCDKRAQSLRLGELHHAVAAGAVPEDFAAIELGEVTSGSQAGRRSDDEMTLCDLTGTGVQDTAIALYAYRRARSQGLGTVIDA